MAEHFYDPVGSCIYCGETDLPEGKGRFEDEHIIPFAFGGNLVLEQASCWDCARKINTQIETPILDHSWGPYRARTGFPTRHPKRRRQILAKPVPLETTDGSQLDISLTEHSTPIPIYIFGAPRLLSNMPADSQRWQVKILTNPELEAEMQRKFPKWNKLQRVRVTGATYARFLAKIAHSYAIAEYGMSATTAFIPLLPGLILGDHGDAFATVGGDPFLMQPQPNSPKHAFQLCLFFSDIGRAFLVLELRLFTQLETPLYRIVVGDIRLNNREHVAMLEKHRADGKIKEIAL